MFADGSLYLTNVQLVHAGNYSCHAQKNAEIVQVHMLRVHSECPLQLPAESRDRSSSSPSYGAQWPCVRLSLVWMLALNGVVAWPDDSQ